MSFINDVVEIGIVNSTNVAEASQYLDEIQKKSETFLTRGHICAPLPLTAKQNRILPILAEYFTPNKIRQLLLPLIKHVPKTPNKKRKHGKDVATTKEKAFGHDRRKISLRALDWGVTNWAKSEERIIFKPGAAPFHIHNEYKQTLSHFKRKNFDPFRRKQSVDINFKGTWYKTTIGQLNFLKWADETGVLQHCIEHLKEIEESQKRATMERDLRKARQTFMGRKHKRQELSRVPDAIFQVVEHDEIALSSLFQRNEHEHEHSSSSTDPR